MAVLCHSDYFDSQVTFKCGNEGLTGCRPTLSVIVDDASHVPAVEAIIAVLYGVKGSLRAELQQHQLLHVIQYADMMQLDSVAQKAVQLLVSVVGELTHDTLDSLCQTTWPDCLLPLLPVFARSAGSRESVQRVLFSMLGNLEAVWAEEKLHSLLLKLPVAAMQLLLSSEQLQIYSEDTVMYTAAHYVAAQPHEQQKAASKLLSQLVRAPHLSEFQLTAQAANEDQTAFNILRSHKAFLRKLLTLKRLGPITSSDVAKLLPTAPQHWQLPPRRILPPLAVGVNVLWQLPVSKIKAAYDSCREKMRATAFCSDSITAPISGTAWKLVVECNWDETGKGVKVGAFSSPTLCPHGVIYKQSFSIEGPAVSSNANSSATATPVGCGWAEFFGCGVLQGPLEKSAWVDKGLPTTGTIELKLTVFGIL